MRLASSATLKQFVSVCISVCATPASRKTLRQWKGIGLVEITRTVAKWPLPLVSNAKLATGTGAAGFAHLKTVHTVMEADIRNPDPEQAWPLYVYAWVFPAVRGSTRFPPIPATLPAPSCIPLAIRQDLPVQAGLMSCGGYGKSVPVGTATVCALCARGVSARPDAGCLLGLPKIGMSFLVAYMHHMLLIDVYMHHFYVELRPALHAPAHDNAPVHPVLERVNCFFAKSGNGGYTPAVTPCACWSA